LFVIGNLLQAIAGVLDVVIQIAVLILFVNALLSWVRPDPGNPIVMFLDRVSDALCAPIRRLFPTAVGGIDFAPFVAMLVLWFLGHVFVVTSLRELALRMG
jgi:YggT family protein